jgi:hypothetical protein
MSLSETISEDVKPMENVKHPSRRIEILYNIALIVPAFLICTCLVAGMSLDSVAKYAQFGGDHGPLTPFMAQFNYKFLCFYAFVMPFVFFYLGGLAKSFIDGPYFQGALGQSEKYEQERLSRRGNLYREIASLFRKRTTG